MAVITPSFINVYMLCPAKARFLYVERLPYEPGAPLIIGRAFGDAVDEYYRARMEGRRAPDVREVYVEVLRREAEGVELSREDKQIIADGVDGGCRALVEYVGSVGPSVIPAGVQVKREMAFLGGKVVGRADVIGGTRKSVSVTRRPILVADVKTVSRPLNDLRGSHLNQLVPYSVRRSSPGVEVEYPVIQIHWAVVSRSPRIGVVGRRLRPSDIVYVDNVARHVAAAVAAGSFPPNRDSFVCSRRHCPFWRRCEEEYGGTVRP